MTRCSPAKRHDAKATRTMCLGAILGGWRESGRSGGRDRRTSRSGVSEAVTTITCSRRGPTSPRLNAAVILFVAASKSLAPRYRWQERPIARQGDHRPRTRTAIKSGRIAPSRKAHECQHERGTSFLRWPSDSFMDHPDDVFHHRGLKGQRCDRGHRPVEDVGRAKRRRARRT